MINPKLPVLLCWQVAFVVTYESCCSCSEIGKAQQGVNWTNSARNDHIPSTERVDITTRPVPEGEHSDGKFLEGSPKVSHIRLSKSELIWYGDRPTNDRKSFIWALGDIHGDFYNTIMILHAAGAIGDDAKWTGGASILVQTGDITDKGPDSKRIYDYLRTLRTEAQAAGGDIIMLLGNHDVMNMCNMMDYASQAETATYGGIYGRIAAFSEKGEYGAFLRTLPVVVKINEIIFAHAGVLPHYADISLDELNKNSIKELENQCDASRNDNSITGLNGVLWTRALSLGPEHEACSLLEKTLNKYQAKLMIVGHTVTESRSIESRCRGKLLLIDTGLSRYMANSPALLEIYGNFTEVKFVVEKKHPDSNELQLVRTSRLLTGVPSLQRLDSGIGRPFDDVESSLGPLEADVKHAVGQIDHISNSYHRIFRFMHETVIQVIEMPQERLHIIIIAGMVLFAATTVIILVRNRIQKPHAS